MAVNSFIRAICEEDEKLSVIDVHPLFLSGNAVKMNLYDQRDNSGVNVSAEGAKCIQNAICKYFEDK